MEPTAKKRALKKLQPTRIAMPEAEPRLRSQNFMEVNCGYGEEAAVAEAARCLFCKKPLCVPGCPVTIDIPGFIRKITEGNLAGAYQILKKSNPLPAICGRVCPQETQCEAACVVGKKGDPVAIGHLERFVGDWGMQNITGGIATNERGSNSLRPSESMGVQGVSVAIIGSGPAGLACAQDLALAGVQVTIFEALHITGGVLSYGIPPFRLPRAIVQQEIADLKRLGVTIDLNKVIGKIFTIEQLLTERGFAAVFIGTGAGLPKFMGIPGEHFNGVMSANEFLTRVNLMKGSDHADTPIGMGKRVAVIGAGNTALDAIRTAKRMGATQATIVYRRSRQESPARIEELRHAEEEGVEFQWLTNPIALHGNAEGHVKALKCIYMKLGEPDSSGRRRPAPIAGSEFLLPADTVIYALGTVANPIIGQSTPGLATNEWGYLIVDPETQMTSLAGVFAGGDVVTGSATVILAMGAGRKAARGILGYLQQKAGNEKRRAYGHTMS